MNSINVVNKNILEVITMKRLETKLKLNEVSKFYQIQYITLGAAVWVIFFSPLGYYTKGKWLLKLSNKDRRKIGSLSTHVLQKGDTVSAIKHLQWTPFHSNCLGLFYNKKDWTLWVFSLWILQSLFEKLFVKKFRREPQLLD